MQDGNNILRKEYLEKVSCFSGLLDKVAVPNRGRPPAVGHGQDLGQGPIRGQGQARTLHRGRPSRVLPRGRGVRLIRGRGRAPGRTADDPLAAGQ